MDLDIAAVLIRRQHLESPKGPQHGGLELKLTMHQARVYQDQSHYMYVVLGCHTAVGSAPVLAECLLGQAESHYTTYPRVVSEIETETHRYPHYATKVE